MSPPRGGLRETPEGQLLRRGRVRSRPSPTWIAPLSGEIVEVNEALSDAPEKINEDPYGEGWLVKVRLSDQSEADSLLDAAAYQQLLG